MYKFSRVLLILTFLMIIFGTGCSKFSQLQKSSDLEAKLKGAIAYYEKKDYYRAGALLEEVLPLVRGRIEAEKALYYLAYTYYRQDQFVMSAYYFKEFYQTYQRSEYTEESIFMHGKSLYMDSPQYSLDQTNTEAAIKNLQEYANRYPKGQFMEETNKLLDEMGQKIKLKTYENTKLYHKIGNYKSAVIAIGGFIDAYPESEFTEEMYYLRFDSQYHMAKNSIEVKQLERYYEAIEFYHNFVDKYPNSKYKKEAETLYELSRNRIQEINSRNRVPE